MTMTCTLAASDLGRVVTSIIWPCALLIGLILVAFIIVVIVRKRSAEPRDSSLGMAFTLTDLRRMRAEGQLSDEEFERTKAKMIAHATRPAETKQSATTTLMPQRRSAGESRPNTQVQTNKPDADENDVELGPNLLDGSADNDFPPQSSDDADDPRH